MVDVPNIPNGDARAMMHHYLNIHMSADAALRAACSDGLSDVSRLLLREMGARVSGVGKTPLHCAAKHGHTKLVRMLVKGYGADVDAMDECDCTPLDAAAQGGHTDTLRMLVKELGADANANNSSALQYAALGCHTEAVQVLVAELGADVNARDGNGLTPLHRAASRGMHVMVRLLASLGANVGAKTPQGMTPLHCASHDLMIHDIIMHTRRVTVRLLLDLGADVDAEDGDGHTPHFYVEMKYMNGGAVRALLAQEGAALKQR